MPGTASCSSTVWPPGSEIAAREPRGVSPGGRERLSHHDRGGRLAMRAGNRHEARSTAGHQLAQRIGATHDRQAQRPGPFQFRMVSRDCGRHNDGPNPLYMAGIVAPPNTNAQGDEIIDTRPRSLGITTSYDDSPVRGNHRQGAHPRPSYAHEVDGSGIPG